MVEKKSDARVTPKTSSATALTDAPGSHKTVKSAILKSSFAPSHFQLSLFASVIQALDSHQLRIHDTISGRLKSQHSPLRPQTQINCFSWGYYRSGDRDGDSQPAKKKKKKIEAAENSERGQEFAVIAVGTNDEHISLFSPLDAKVVCKLSPAHPRGTRDIQFRDYGINSEAWSLGADGVLFQWNLRSGQRVRSLPVAGQQETLCVFTLLRKSVLVASHNIFLQDLDSEETKATFWGKDSIHSLLVSPKQDIDSDTSTLLTAAQSSRYINVYDTRSASLVGSLVADDDIDRLILQEEGPYEGQEQLEPLLAAVSKDGKLSIFESPFSGWKVAGSRKEDLKMRSKRLARKPQAWTHVVRPDDPAKAIPILNASFQHTDLVLALAQGSVDLSFERVSWCDESGRFSLPQSIVRTKTKGLAVDAGENNGVKNLSNTHINESQAIMAQGSDMHDEDTVNGKQEVIEISSAEDESEESDSDEEDSGAEERPAVNGFQHEEEKMIDSQEENTNRKDQAQDEEDEEPSFGDQLRAKSIGTVDVSAALPDITQKSMVPVSGKADVSTNLSLGTVLSQSLRTNDNSLLETCLQVQDLQIVRATIERLGSDLAITLLQKLAERLHNRPGRAGSLLVWIQWTLVAHGGYLSARPDAVKKLTSLHNVVRERARSLQPLLSLKGKLDMLEAQINLRKSLRRDQESTSGQGKSWAPLVYVEGQEDSGSDSDIEIGALAGRSTKQAQLLDHLENVSSTSDEDREASSDAMEVDGDNDIDNDSEEDSVATGTSESTTSQDEDSDDSVDYDDVDPIEQNGQEALAVSEIQNNGSARNKESRMNRG